MDLFYALLSQKYILILVCMFVCVCSGSNPGPHTCKACAPFPVPTFSLLFHLLPTEDCKRSGIQLLEKETQKMKCLLYDIDNHLLARQSQHNSKCTVGITLRREKFFGLLEQWGDSVQRMSLYQ